MVALLSLENTTAGAAALGPDRGGCCLWRTPAGSATPQAPPDLEALSFRLHSSPGPLAALLTYWSTSDKC